MLQRIMYNFIGYIVCSLYCKIGAEMPEHIHKVCPALALGRHLLKIKEIKSVILEESLNSYKTELN